MKAKLMLTMMAVGIAALMSACGGGASADVACVTTAAGCIVEPKDPPPPPVHDGALSDDEYAVYSDIISSQTKSTLEMYQKYPITGMPKVNASDVQYAMYYAVSAASADWVKKPLEEGGVDTEIINDFLAKKAADIDGSRLTPEVAPQIALINDEILADLSSTGRGPDDFWKSFYEKFPMAVGYNSFSRVGFSTRKDKALLIVNQSCGSLCGSGSWELYEKRDGHWVFVKSGMLWIS